MKKIGVVTLLLVIFESFGQTLPRFVTNDELKEIGHYQNTRKQLEGNSKIDFPVRTMAEWEESAGVAIAWDETYKHIQVQIVRAVKEECKVIIACKDSNSVRSYLQNNGIIIDSTILFISAKYNSIWIRDYGPTTAYKNDVEDRILIDWIYNRPRYQDDTLSNKIGQTLNLPVYTTNMAPTDLVHTGGNFMSDGLGQAFSSKLVLTENGVNNSFGTSNHSLADVENIMNQFMGIKSYPLMNTLPFDGIHHIDMHMKLLDERRLLVGKYENDASDGMSIEANINYVLQNFKNSFGKPFEIIYMPMPKDKFGRFPNQNGDYLTYTNALFVNKSILVPIYNLPIDSLALDIWKNAMPGYKVIGILCEDIIKLSGAIHCITKEIGVIDPFMIAVDALPNFIKQSNETALVKAIVKHKSGIKSVKLQLKYKNEEAWKDSTVLMSLVNADKNIFEAALPKFQDSCYYYVEATSNSSKTLTRPIVAPQGKYLTQDTTSLVRNNELNHHNNDAFIYPNPATNKIYIDFLYPFDVSHIEIYNILGKNFTNHIQWILVGDLKYELNVQNLISGHYFVKLHSENKNVITQKFQVQ